MVFTRLPHEVPKVHEEPQEARAKRIGATPPIPHGMPLPLEGQLLLVELPGERLRATVRKVTSSDYLIVELTDIPLAKSHSYQKGDFVPCEKIELAHETIWRSFRPQPKMPDMPPPVEEQRKKRVRTANRDRRKPRKPER